MKKFLTLCVAALVAVTTVSAKDYKHSIGMVAGVGVGAQYKTMVADHFTIIAEYGYFMNLDGGTANKYGFASYSGAIANGVFAFQTSPLAEGQGIKLSLYAGGQMKIGYANIGIDAGVFGVGAAAGIEANMTNAPIAFSFDFRPGYAMVFGDPWNGVVDLSHMFDYSFNLGVRYTF